VRQKSSGYNLTRPDLTYVWFDFHPEYERAGEWKSPGAGCPTECVCSYLIVSLITVCVLFVCMYVCMIIMFLAVLYEFNYTVDSITLFLPAGDCM
jgi:hypothetical protein